MHQLNTFARISLSHSPTPLEKLPRLSAYLGVIFGLSEMIVLGWRGEGTKPEN